LTEDKETKLESLLSELEASDSIMISMRKAVDQKSVQLKNLESELSELNQKMEATKQENVKMKRDLAWAKSYCTEMNQKVIDLTTQTSAVPTSKTYSRIDRRQNKSQERGSMPEPSQFQASRPGALHLGASNTYSQPGSIVKQEEQPSNSNTEKPDETCIGIQTSSTSLSNHLALVSANSSQQGAAVGGLRLVPLSQLQAPAKSTRLPTPLTSRTLN